MIQKSDAYNEQYISKNYSAEKLNANLLTGKLGKKRECVINSAVTAVEKAITLELESTRKNVLSYQLNARRKYIMESLFLRQLAILSFELIQKKRKEIEINTRTTNKHTAFEPKPKIGPIIFFTNITIH